jgi:hypothetical protein
MPEAATLDQAKELFRKVGSMISCALKGTGNHENLGSLLRLLFVFNRDILLKECLVNAINFPVSS